MGMDTEPVAAPEPTARQCGRCRVSFAPDPDVPLGVLPAWWLCPPCKATLLTGAPRRRAAPAAAGT
jgi:hypothetical protein